MTKYCRWIAVTALLMGVVQPAASQSVSPLSERVSQFPDTSFQAWFGTMLEAEYWQGPDWRAFFGDVGPTEGCSAHKRLKSSIVERDLVQFRAAYVTAVATGMNSSTFEDIPDKFLVLQFNSRIDRFRANLRTFLHSRVLELGNGGREWIKQNGYLGRKLGFNAAGKSYWGEQPAMTTLVCLFPNDAGLLRGWKP